MYIDKNQQLNIKKISQETHAIKLEKNSVRRLN